MAQQASQVKVAFVGYRARAISYQLVFWLTLVGWSGLIVWLSIARYTGYNVGMLDLGNMAQSINSVKRGAPLVSSYGTGSMSRLALHVELIYFLIAPFYALWSDPRLLLMLQAILFVLGALPVSRLALRHNLGQLGAYCLAALYLFYPVALTSVLFDFHGDTLAMPLLLFAIDALDRRAWRSYALFVALALSCKFYVALPVALLGVMAWWCYRERRIACLTVGAAVVYGLVAFFVIRPLFTTEYTPAAQSGLNYLAYYFGGLEQALKTWRDRRLHAFVVFGPALLLIWAGWRWLVPALPVSTAALLSTGPGPAYAYWFHHYALVVPFIMMAAIVGAAELAGSRFRPAVPPWRRWLALLLVVITTLAVLMTTRKYVDTPLNPKFWYAPGLGLDDQAFGRTSRDAMKDQFLAAQVPPEVPLAASPLLAPHLTDRAVLFPDRDISSTPGYSLDTILPKVDYVLADALFDHPSMGPTDVERPAIARVLGDPSFGPVASRDGLFLFQRAAPAGRRLVQRVEAQNAPPGLQVAAEDRFGRNIGLVEADVVSLGSRRFRATFVWTLTGPALPQARFAAVSRIEGLADARIVHLPTYALLPVSRWQPGKLVRETFDVELPDELPPGKYTWSVGWYDLARPPSETTDRQSRLPGSQEIAAATVEVQQ